MGATRGIFLLSFVRRSRRGLQEGRKGVSAIIISPALPVIAIVLTNAKIAFQIALPSPSPSPSPEKTGSGARNALFFLNANGEQGEKEPGDASRARR